MPIDQKASTRGFHGRDRRSWGKTQYYLAQTEYYLGGREPQGAWVLVGSGLGLDEQGVGAPVDRYNFERLHAGRGVNGSSLADETSTRTDRVGAYDATFSAPKSVSLLWAFADRDLRASVEAAQRQAVAAAVKLLDENAAFCRRGKAGATREKVSLTAAVFQHGEARPATHADGAVFADPAHHHHACILNLAQRGDGSFGALDGKALFNWKMAAGAIYHAELAASLQTLGFAIESSGTNGLFEIAGVSTDLRTYFSARRKEIEDELHEIGVEASAKAPALAAALAQATRSAKLDAKDRDTIWHERMADKNLSPANVIDSARQAATQKAPIEDQDELIAQRLAAIPEQLTETRSIFEHRHLVAAVASALVGSGASTSRIMEEVRKLESADFVRNIGRDKRWRQPIYSTPEVIRIEFELQACALRLGASPVMGAPIAQNINLHALAANLNEEQQAAAFVAATSAGLAIIEGAPGVGKTTLLKPVVQAWREAGWQVIAAATAWKTATAMSADLDVEGRAIDSWLARAAKGVDFLPHRTVLIVDEAGLANSKQLYAVLTHVEIARNMGRDVAVRLIGDRRQLQAIGGPGLSIVANTIGVQRVDQIVRQREAWAREAVSAFGVGNAASALMAFNERGLLRFSGGPNVTAREIVTAWAEACDGGSERSTLMIAKTNGQVLKLNSLARQHLRSAGRIGDQDEAIVDAVTPAGHLYQLTLSTGDKVRFLKRIDELGVVNGSEGEVVTVERHGQSDAEVHLTVRLSEKSVRLRLSDLADEAGRIRLAHAYASTVYGAQGQTVESAFVWADPTMDRHDIHVAASRARHETTLFADQAQTDAHVRSNRLLVDRSRPVSHEERISTLAVALSRSGEKISTLDFAVSIGPRLEKLTAKETRLQGRDADAPIASNARPKRDRAKNKRVELEADG